MKEQILKIAKDLEQGTITETEAQNLLLGLLIVGGSFSHFEDIEGNKYHLNGHYCEKGEISFIFSDGKLLWYIEVENGFDIDLKLVVGEANSSF